MAKDKNKIEIEELVNKIKEYLETIHKESSLKNNFAEFDKYYEKFIENKGVENILRTQKQSKDINQNHEKIKALQTEITKKQNTVDNLTQQIGIEGTEKEEATGLHKDIADLMQEKKELRDDIKNLNDGNIAKKNVQEGLKIEIEKLKTAKEQLQKEIGIEGTEQEEATGLHKDIVDLIVKKKSLEECYEQKDKELLTKHNNNIENLESQYQEKNDNLKKKFSEEKSRLDDEVKNRKAEIKKLDDEVQNVKDLTELKKENKKHISLYFYISIGVLFALLIIMVIAIWGFWDNAEKYINFVNKEQNIFFGKLTSLDMLSFAFSFLLMKLPFALVFGFLLAGGFNVLRSCINHYENIHKEIRDISSIYAITGRMNVESVLIIKQIKQYDEKEIKDFLDNPNEEDRKHLKERLKWEQISDYLSSRGKSNIAESQELKTSATNTPNNLIPILSQITKIIRALK